MWKSPCVFGQVQGERTLRNWDPGRVDMETMPPNIGSDFSKRMSACVQHFYWHVPWRNPCEFCRCPNGKPMTRELMMKEATLRLWEASRLWDAFVYSQCGMVQTIVSHNVVGQHVVGFVNEHLKENHRQYLATTYSRVSACVFFSICSKINRWLFNIAMV